MKLKSATALWRTWRGQPAGAPTGNKCTLTLTSVRRRVTSALLHLQIQVYTYNSTLTSTNVFLHLEVYSYTLKCTRNTLQNWGGPTGK